jgi:hypothetical protein
MPRIRAFGAKGVRAMTTMRDGPRSHSSFDDDPERPRIRALDRRIRLWETATGLLCALFLWAPMAAAAFQGVG